MSSRPGYGPLPDGWQLESEHFNDEGERLGIAASPDHPIYGDQRLLVIWDDPTTQRGSGVAAVALLDRSANGWLSAQVSSGPLVYTFESFDSEGELTELTFPLGPLDVLAELHICGGLSEDGARSVFPVLSAPGVVMVSMPGGWSFRLTSEEER